MQVDLRRIVVCLTLVALAGIPLGGEVFYTRLFTRIMLYAIVACSLDLILGYGGMVSFGHAAFVGVGAYTVAILGYHGVTSGLIAWPASVVMAALLALVIGGISLRTSGVYFIMITLAFAQMLYYLAVSLKTYGGDDGVRIVRNTFARRLMHIDLCSLDRSGRFRRESTAISTLSPKETGPWNSISKPSCSHCTSSWTIFTSATSNPAYPPVGDHRPR